jgi:hypothetical protein
MIAIIQLTNKQKFIKYKKVYSALYWVCLFMLYYVFIYAL